MCPVCFGDWQCECLCKNNQNTYHNKGQNRNLLPVLRERERGYACEDGNRTCCLTKKPAGAQNVVTTGKYLYYGFKRGTKLIVRRMTVKDKKVKTLAKITIGYETDASFEAYYNGTIYFTMFDDPQDPENGNMYKYRISTKSKSLVLEGAGGGAHQYGKYLLTRPNTGDYGPYPLRRINMQTGEIRIFSDEEVKFNGKGNYVYVAEVSGGQTDISVLNIIRYRIMTGAQKFLVRDLKADMVYKITKSNIYYRRSGKFYCYTYSTGKAVKCKYSDIPA